MLSSKPSPTPKPAPKAAPAKSGPKPKPAAAVAAPLKPPAATAPPPRASTSAASSSSSSSSTSTSSIKQLHKSSRLATVASLQQKKQNLLTNTGLAIHSEDVGAVSVGELLEKSRRGSQWPGLGDATVGMKGNSRKDEREVAKEEGSECGCISIVSVAAEGSDKNKYTPSELRILSLHQFFSESVAQFSKSVATSEPMETLETHSRVTVCVRIRPLLSEERAQGLYMSTTTSQPSTLHLHSIGTTLDGSSPVLKSKSFAVDCVFDEMSSSEAVYTQSGVRSMLESVVSDAGMGCVVAYGQTGSGKTFTMTAIETLVARDLFSITSRQIASKLEIHVCFFEIFGNRVRDLLAFPNDLMILEDVFGKVQVKGVLEVHVRTAEEVLAVIERGAAHRRTEGTSKNATSSRSHAICRIRVKNLSRPEAEDGVLHLLDLAGSESSADTRWHNKERVLESVGINKSLATLKECIQKRAAVDDVGTSGVRQHIHVPYRSSKLTMLLKDAFEVASGRACRTVVIAMVNPSILDTPQSLSTLRYVAPLKMMKQGSKHTTDPNDPREWTNTELCARVSALCGSIDTNILCPYESGKQILRLSEAEFIERCTNSPGVTVKAAKDFYDKIWGLVIDARSKRNKREC